MNGISDVRQRTWDFALTVITVGLLASLGVQSFVGTLYVWWAQRTIPNWEQLSYTGYVNAMNAIAAPQLIALVVVMGLCVPKRLFDRTLLIAVSVGMVAVAVVAGIVTGSLGTGVTVYLALAALIQVAVVVLTAVGTRAPSYLTQGRLTKLGSGLLHLGFIVFALVVAALQRSAFMLPVFWASTVLVIGGTALSFWANKLAVKRTVPVEHNIDF
ncbi:MAG: hypothetical protein FDZ75_00055 [Actinobacteria bacterium]|nr:MAG: hypothetical protein FDZ75_00055 [Actinomycetota bacterium]